MDSYKKMIEAELAEIVEDNPEMSYDDALRAAGEEVICQIGFEVGRVISAMRGGHQEAMNKTFWN